MIRKDAPGGAVDANTTDRPSALDLADDSMCFACGKDNAHGLHLTFVETDGGLATTISFDQRFQGYRGVVHGGLISTVLDETMVTLLNRRGILALTAELTVRFVSPVRVGEPITVTARLVDSRRNIHRLEATATRDGATVARSTARFMTGGKVPDSSAG